MLFGVHRSFGGQGSRFARLWREESGQATVEYILILSAIVVGCVKFTQVILAILDKGILTLGSQLEKDLKTGRAWLGIWKN